MQLSERPRTHPEINKFRRESLIQATLQVVAEHGIENATVARICEAAGASRGLANHYFSGKEELLLLAFEKLLEDLKEATGKAAKLQATPAGKLLAIVRTIFSEELFSNTARAAYLCFWTASLSNPQFKKVKKINRSS
jgi:TetR/AcrR family transcriptional regulator, transcriptional repressor of bet genes